MTKRTAKEWARRLAEGKCPAPLFDAIEHSRWYLVSAWFRQVADALDQK